MICFIFLTNGIQIVVVMGEGMDVMTIASMRKIKIVKYFLISHKNITMAMTFRIGQKQRCIIPIQQSMIKVETMIMITFQYKGSINGAICFNIIHGNHYGGNLDPIEVL